ncbi:MAG: hypothetical protein WAL29_11045 [Bacteroidales bacterium]
MKTDNKYRWLVWIVILAVMNIATIITVIYNRNRTSREIVAVETSQTGSETSSIRYSGRWFRDQLNLSNEQMDRFVEFNPVFRQNVMNINQGLNLLRQKMLSEMASENFDTIRLNTLSDSIGFLHAGLKKVTYKYYIDIKNICDQQQQEKLEQLFGGMFASDGRMGQFGKGGQQGRRRGRQVNN